MGKSLNLWGSPSEVQRNVTTKIAYAHEQSELTFDAYLVAAGHLNGLTRDINTFKGK